MLATRSLPLLALLALLAAAAAAPRASRLRRQLPADDVLQPLETGSTWRRRAGARGARGTRGQLSPSSWPLSRSSRTGSPASPRPRRQATDDIPVFDRNKVSLDLPGSLFGPSVSLLIRTTKIIGDVIQNSAVRYQTFLRLFRPLFRGPFEIKGLDPATTTTTTTTPRAPPAADNEVRRR
ncbi:uncharacterized protein LOC124640979 isoform X2 [Helicoverpa zea]|uniref:uncharacterized protein LOC124640979 isoform X2 n=1 Tax=Helicoverpa zea TaxID=7113 RepID=UPI001F5A2383|nr:uncharacterized protein LOC124640979 isoform X2 [Helicoverpa zea]